jgi:hypothetical protein
MAMRIICFVSFSAFVLTASAQTSLPFGYTHPQLMEWATGRDFKVEIKDGIQTYCHNVTPLGTHLPVRQCLTELQLAQAKHVADTAGPGPPPAP